VAVVAVEALNSSLWRRDNLRSDTVTVTRAEAAAHAVAHAAEAKDNPNAGATSSPRCLPRGVADAVDVEAVVAVVAVEALNSSPWRRDNLRSDTVTVTRAEAAHAAAPEAVDKDDPDEVEREMAWA